MFAKKVQAQSLDTLSWTEIKAEADSIYKDGGDTAYILNEETIAEGRTSKTNHLQTINALGTKAGSLSLGYEIGVTDISINLSSNLETINQGLFGVNVTGMFQNSVMPNDGSAEDQWQWLADMAPKAIRFPSGANSEFMQLYNNCDRGYGYNIEEIVKYFDITDHKMDYPDIATIVGYSDTINISVFNSWMDNGWTNRFNELRLAYKSQLNVTAGHKYIDDFIQLIKQMETTSGKTVDVLVCLNIINETAAENKNIVNYLRNVIPNSENYAVNVVGVEMGNEVASKFYKDIMQFEQFNDYWDYINGEAVNKQHIVDSSLGATIFLPPTDRNFLATFKNTAGFSCKVGIPADGTGDPNTVFFSPGLGAGFRTSYNWNDTLKTHYGDVFSGTTKLKFDAIILHNYFATISGTKSWWNDEFKNNLDESYTCPKWTYLTTDARLDTAFDAAGIKFQKFINTYHKAAFDDFDSIFDFHLSGTTKKDVWITEWNLKPGEETDERTQTVVNGFLHGYVIQEWWFKNLKLNYKSAYRKNFFTYCTIQNYGSTSSYNLLSNSDENVELDLVSRNYSPYNLDVSNVAKRNYQLRRTTYFTFNLIGEIHRSNLKYMKHGAAKFATNPNILPTVFIKPSYDTIYIYYTNRKDEEQKYILNTGSMGGLYSGDVYGVLFGTPVIYAVNAAQAYSTSGKSYLFDKKFNDCYDDDVYNIEIDKIDTTGMFAVCSDLPDNRCVTVPKYSFGYIKIPVAPNHIPPDDKLAAIEIKIKIYPNPAQNYLYIQSSEQIKEIKITNSFGAIQQVEFSASNNIAIDQLKAGIYFIKIEDSTGNLFYSSFIKI